MVKGITLSLSDPAGVNMLQRFIEKGFKETSENQYNMDDKMVFAIDHLIVPAEQNQKNIQPQPYPVDYTSLASKYDLDYIVVASRHWGMSGSPTLTAHPTGNFGDAMYGGNPRELQYTSPDTMRNIFLNLLAEPPDGFQVSLEATHHSPTEFKVPMFFVEIGSREEQWRDEQVGDYVVDCILNGIDSKETAPKAIGFGGGHYCPKFSEYIKEYAMGHMAAKYAVELLDESLVEQMLEKSDGAETILFDKGLKGKHKRRVVEILDNLGLESP